MSDTQTMRLHAGAPWHRESFDKFFNETLPQLLAERMPLASYSVKSSDIYTCRVKVAVENVEVEYAVLQPDENGLFMVDGNPFVVVPVASNENLDTAEVKCVGEQLYDYVASHVGKASNDLPWDEQLVQAWLPLDAWVRSVVTSADPEGYVRWATGQRLDNTNGIAVRTHLRRIIIRDIERVITPGQFGRVCPFETPEGPNIGHVFSVALGAVIRNGRIEIMDDHPEATLGLAASMVPFLEHNDANRALLGVNGIRLCRSVENPEPALVQTGNEPDGPDIWCGRNLLTAFVSAGAQTYEDAILVSETCANRLGYPEKAGVGDRIQNRHGQKGVISRILPDDEMPHLADGTPVELVCSFIGLHARLNFGQVREAIMGRIARAEGAPVIVTPFHAPSDAEFGERLRKLGLPEDGMEALIDGKTGMKMERPSAVGWVYWGKSVFTSERLFSASVIGPPWTSQGENDYYAFRDIGCFETLMETFSTRSADRPDAEEFIKQVESGPVEQAPPPAPRFRELTKRLNAAGIIAEFGDTGISFKMGHPTGEMLKLAQPVPHPWLKEHSLTEVGMIEEVPGHQELAKANEKLRRTIEGGAPDSIRQKATADLEDRVDGFLNSLVTPEVMRMHNRVMLHWRGVLAPGHDLKPDQVGLAENAAWTMFGPLLIRELGDRSQVEQRTQEAARVLDEIMARSWVIVNRSPTILPTSHIAFHPVRIPDTAVRLHPLMCLLMNGDFDGDQAAVFLPITEAGQREAGEKLSLAGHLRRDPNLFDLKLLTHEVLWGLAHLSRTSEGLREISGLAGVGVAAPGGIVNRETVATALREVMSRDGVDAVIDAMQRLMEKGFQVARESGASISPFVGESLVLPAQPAGDDPDAWKAFIEEAIDALQSYKNYDSQDLGPQILAVKSGARGSVEQLLRLVAPFGPVTDAAGRSVPVRHGFQEGLAAEEMFACVAGAREGLARIAHNIAAALDAYGHRADKGPKGFGVLSRAMRASRPGSVFARAAASGEIDPLTDLDARLFVGLRP